MEASYRYRSPCRILLDHLTTFADDGLSFIEPRIRPESEVYRGMEGVVRQASGLGSCQQKGRIGSKITCNGSRKPQGSSSNIMTIFGVSIMIITMSVIVGPRALSCRVFGHVRSLAAPEDTDKSVWFLQGPGRSMDQSISGSILGRSVHSNVCAQ